MKIMTRKTNRLPGLELLLEGTPLSLLRLKEAWPALTTRERAELFTLLLADPAKEPLALQIRAHRNAVLDIALNDDNAFIRHLAARYVSRPWRYGKSDNDTAEFIADTTRFEKVKSDASPLVRHSRGESFDDASKDAASFWKREQTERLALVNGVEGEGEEMARLLLFAAKELIPSGTVSINDASDVLLQYLGARPLAEWYADKQDAATFTGDGWIEYSADKSLAALWATIPNLPPELAHILLDRLPEDGSDEVLASLSEKQLEQLLWRRDVRFKDLRLITYKNSKSKDLRIAALSGEHFDFDDKDLSALIYNSKDSIEEVTRKGKELADVAMYCGGLTLVQIDAIRHYLKELPEKADVDDAYMATQSLRERQTYRARILEKRDGLHYEVESLRLWALAKQLASAEYGKETLKRITEEMKPGRFSFFTSPKLEVVDGDAWQTYLNLRKYDVDARLYPLLPRVDVGDFELPESVFEKRLSHHDMMELRDTKLNDLLADVQKEISDLAPEDKAKLEAITKAFTAISRQILKTEEALTKKVAAIADRLSAEA